MSPFIYMIFKKDLIQKESFFQLKIHFDRNLEPDVDVDWPDIWQHVEQSSAVDDEKYEEKRLFQSTSLESDSEACEGDESDFDVGDMYHLDIIVALTETESGEEDSVFIDALTEMEG